MTKHDDRHRGAYDRGRADYWYGRPVEPHYFTGGTSHPDCPTRVAKLTAKQRAAYIAGYEDGEEDGGQKEWY